MAYYFRRKLNEYNMSIEDSIHQLSEYLNQSHCINMEYITLLHQNITTVIIPEQMALLETTGNIVSELKTILSLEEKRRKPESQLKVADKKGAVKKGRVEKRKKPTNPYPYINVGHKEPPHLPSSQPLNKDQKEATPSTSKGKFIYFRNLYTTFTNNIYIYIFLNLGNPLNKICCVYIVE